MQALPHLLRSLVAAAAASALGLGSALAAPTIAVTGPSTVTQNTSFSLAITATDVVDLYGWQLDIAFNPVLFRAGAVTEGSFLTTAGTTFFDGGVVDNVHGTISFAFDTLLGAGPGASGSGTLARLAFTSIGDIPSFGTFGLANVTALNASLATMTVATSSLNVTTVAAVPEPESWGLMLAGLGAMVAWTVRRRG